MSTNGHSQRWRQAGKWCARSLRVALLCSAATGATAYAASDGEDLVAVAELPQSSRAAVVLLPCG